MKIPGFTAEASLFTTKGHNQRTRNKSGDNGEQAIVQQLDNYLENCGPCKCHFYGSGITASRECFKICDWVIVDVLTGRVLGRFPVMNPCHFVW